MRIDNSQCTPALIDNDKCYSKFKCSLSELNSMPFYTITAIREKETGTYYLNDEYGDLILLLVLLSTKMVKLKFTKTATLKTLLK